MIKLFATSLVAALVLQACAGSSSGPNAGPAAQAPSAPSAPGAPSQPGQPGQPPAQPPGTTRPQGGDYFADIDKAIAASATGNLLVTERFNILMARLSVYALICDSKNQYGYSTQFSKLYNQSTDLQKLSEKTYGSQPAAYNRLEKQRNIESRRLSFEVGPNACALSASPFEEYMRTSASQVASAIKTTPRGSF